MGLWLYILGLAHLIHPFLNELVRGWWEVCAGSTFIAKSDMATIQYLENILPSIDTLLDIVDKLSLSCRAVDLEHKCSPRHISKTWARDLEKISNNPDPDHQVNPQEEN